MPNPLRAAICAAVFLACGAARAHDQWANGEPVPDFVKKACCGVADAHHFADSDVTEQGDGLHIIGYPAVIPYSEVLPSPDGSTWVFYASYDHLHRFCVFHGVSGS